ncbi:MAG: PD40 domain-containing protein, partial [Bacteroidetes bacterium]|nr:PD40 domain-containing protein [Bacteroidota bacterium]
MRSFNIIAGLCLLLACSCRQRNGIITNAGLVKQRLSTLACYDGQPVISPDGKFLAFVSSQLGDRHIFTLELESEQRDALTVNEGIDEEPRFSPDNQQVVFVSRIGGRSDLWIIDKDENLLQLTKTEYDQESFPCWSADGKQIYFVVSMAYGSEIRRVLRTNFTDVATVLTDSLQFGKLWNDPAGRWLFAERRSKEQSDIVKIDLGNPSVTRFVNSTYVEKSPAISPDGQWLAYISNASGFDEIWITPTDNVLPIQVTFDSTSHDNPTWSEDGQSLFFEETSNWDIKITDVETQVESVLVGHRMNDEAPVFSADGQMLYFVSDRNGKKGIYALDMQSTLVDPVLVDDYNNFDPELSPDGREMVFTSDRTGIRHLWL